MAYRGHVENGVVVLDEKADLREGPDVVVTPVRSADIPTLAEQLKGVIGIVDDLPEDMAENHNHYIRAARPK